MNLEMATLLMVKSSLLLAAALLILALLPRNTNPRWRLLLCRASLLGVLILPLTLLLPDSAKVFPIPAQTQASDEAVRNLITIPEAPVLTGESSTAPSAHPFGVSAPDSGPVIRTEAGAALSWIEILGWSYLALSAVLCAHLLFGFLRLGGWIRQLPPASDELQSILRRVCDDLGYSSRPPHLLLSRVNATPFSLGTLRPAIVLPRGLAKQVSHRELEFILRHEVQHLRNRDLIWTALTQMAAALLWFHPLFWLLKRAHSLAQEELSDRVAAGSGDVRSYSALLARLAIQFSSQRPAAPLGAIGLIRKPQILNRLRHLKNYHAEHSPLSRFRAGLFLCAFTASLLLLATLAMSAKTKVAAETPLDNSGLALEKQREVKDSLRRARSYLLGKQLANGSFGKEGHDASPGVTALAGASFIGSKEEKEQKALALALDFVLKSQDVSGYFKNDHGASIYHHSISLWFLAKSKKHVAKEQRGRVGRAIELGVKLLISAQETRKVPAAAGGWRYSPIATDSDTSCTAWALRALYAAREAGHKVEAPSTKKAEQYMMRLWDPATGSLGYTSRNQGMKASLPRSAFALYVMINSGRKKDDPAVNLAAQSILKMSKSAAEGDFGTYGGYGNFWSADAMAQLGGRDWKEYAKWMYPHYLKGQEKDGSWKGPFSSVLTTALTIHAFE